MYWNSASWQLYALHIPININMRCIEIEYLRLCKRRVQRLTLTWDVLKYDIDN